MAWTAISAATGSYGAVSATTGTHANLSATTGSHGPVSATTGSHGVGSRSSTWTKFNTLRPIGSDDVDFVYRASATDPVIANSIIAVCITDRSEQP